VSKKEEAKPKNRKDQILKAAFSLAQANVSWSMSDLAQRVGVSKTALYRHFSNRAEIESELESITLKKLLATIEKVENNAASVRCAIVIFLRKNPDIFMYLTRNIITVEDFESKTLLYLKRKSPRIHSFFVGLETLSAEMKENHLIGIQKNVITMLLVSFNEKSLLPLQNLLLSRNSTGFPELSIPSKQRLDELETIRIEEDPSDEIERKLLQAVAAAIQQQGIPNVTVENIAMQLGTAKSSLYSHYASKKAMLSKLINGEINTILTLLDRYVMRGKNFEEQLYLVMLVHTRHLLSKPDIIPVFNWIRYEMITQHYEMGRPDIDTKEFLRPFHPVRIGENGCEDQDQRLVLIRWVATLSSSCSIRGYELGSTEKEILKYIRIMYKHILYGDKELL